jgi:hypothetical protein
MAFKFKKQFACHLTPVTKGSPQSTEKQQVQPNWPQTAHPGLKVPLLEMSPCIAAISSWMSSKLCTCFASSSIFLSFSPCSDHTSDIRYAMRASAENKEALKEQETWSNLHLRSLQHGGAQACPATLSTASRYAKDTCQLPH